MRDLRERKIIKRIQDGERELISTLADSYYDEIYRFCYYTTGNQTAAYDVTQNTFLHLVTSIDSYAERNQFKAYLYCIARNCCNDYFRSLHNYENLDDQQIEASGDHMLQADNSLLIQSCLEQLPLFQREVLILYFYQGFKIHEIATITRSSVPTVKSRLRQGKDKLKKILSKEGIDSYER